MFEFRGGVYKCVGGVIVNVHVCVSACVSLGEFPTPTTKYKHLLFKRSSPPLLTLHNALLLTTSCMWRSRNSSSLHVEVMQRWRAQNLNTVVGPCVHTTDLPSPRRHKIISDLATKCQLLWPWLEVLVTTWLPHRAHLENMSSVSHSPG